MRRSGISTFFSSRYYSFLFFVPLFFYFQLALLLNHADPSEPLTCIVCNIGAFACFPLAPVRASTPTSEQPRPRGVVTAHASLDWASKVASPMFSPLQTAKIPAFLVVDYTPDHGQQRKQRMPNMQNYPHGPRDVVARNERGFGSAEACIYLRSTTLATVLDTARLHPRPFQSLVDARQCSSNTIAGLYCPGGREQDCAEVWWCFCRNAPSSLGRQQAFYPSEMPDIEISMDIIENK